MRRAIKYPDSKIVTDQLKYQKDSSKISKILVHEQKSFCAYTDEYISRTDAKDIDHFDPTLKGTSEDSYQNWFLVKHQVNKEKSNRWNKYQPILHPTAADFEVRIIYIDGDYFSKSDSDIEANNLISLLKLDDAELAQNRKKYIKRKLEEMKAYGQDAFTFFTTLILADKCRISYLRAISEEFKIDIWTMLS